jgi:hypothetical protein
LNESWAIAPSIRSDCVELAYDAIGDPADPPIALIAGLSSQLVSWAASLEAGRAGDLAVIQVANQSRVGLPARAFLCDLDRAAVFRTDRLGTIELLVGASGWQPAG